MHSARGGRPLSSIDRKVKALLEGRSPEVVAWVKSLRQLVLTVAPQLREEVKPGWRSILYKGNGAVCAIAPHRGHVNLHFYQGTGLPDPEGLLEGTGKALRHVKIRQRRDLRADALTRLVEEAVKLDAG